MKEFIPKPFVVYATRPAYTHSGHRFEERTYRIGPAADLPEARALIAEDRKPADTLGGLIDWGPNPKRTYHVFRANWERVTNL